jgi:hypothetical protein
MTVNKMRDVSDAPAEGVAKSSSPLFVRITLAAVLAAALVRGGDGVMRVFGPSP